MKTTLVAMTLALTAGWLAPQDGEAAKRRVMQRSASTGDLQARADELFAEARLHAELGGNEAAMAAYRTLEEDRAQPLAVRGRASLGHAVMQRRIGHATAWIDPFFRAIAAARELEDVELALEIIEASGAIRPGVESWAEVEPLLAFKRTQDEEGREVVEPPDGLMARAARTTDSQAFSIGTAVLWPPSEYTGTPISVAFKDAELRDLFRMFHQISGVNIVLDEDLAEEKVTIEVADVPWDQVMALVMKTKGLAASFDGEVLRVARKGEIEQAEIQRRALQEARELAGEVRSIARTLSHVDGEVALDAVRARLSARGAVQLDRRTNTVIVKELSSRLDALEELLDELDVETSEDPRFKGERISLSFEDAELGGLFALFGQVAGLDLRPDIGLLDRKVSLHASDQPWDEALWRILATQRLVLIAHDGGYAVIERPDDELGAVAYTLRDSVTVLMRPAGGWGHGALDILPPIKRLGL